MIGIILAAGEGKRLKGIVPAGLKPLIIVNGQSLITRLAHQVREIADQTIIVASPRNVEAIVDVMDDMDDLNYIIQPKPTGPGDALLRVLRVIDNGPFADDILVVMGDNLMDIKDVQAVADSRLEGPVIGVGNVPEAELHRFTRVWRNTVGDIRSEEGPNVTAPGALAWIGPLRLPAKETAEVLLDHSHDDPPGELKIGAYLGEICERADASGTLTPVNAQDIGTPEALR